jgi:hypothetical protein
MRTCSSPSAPPRPAPAPHGFDYGVLPASVGREVRERTASIHGLLAKTSLNVVQIGLQLRVVREAVGRDRFQPWLKAEFQWSQSVASNYMRAAKAFAELDCLGRFHPSALFALARKKCPPAAQAEAVRRARRGERITKALAIELAGRHAPQAGGRTSGVAERARQSLLKALPKLSAEQLEELAAEILEMARKRKANTQNG